MSQKGDFIHREERVKRPPPTAAEQEETLKREKKAKMPSSLVVRFEDGEKNRTGPPVEIPAGSSLKQLETLINALLENEDSLPYGFYINDVEVVSSVEDTITQLIDSNKGPSFEEALTVSYQPLSVYRVRPVTRCSETMPGHTDAVLHVSYSPDGSRLGSGGGDGAVRFWNTTTSLPMHTCLGHKNHILCACWTPDGKTFITADRNGEIRIWDPKTGNGLGQPLRGHKKWVTSLACEPFHSDPTCSRLASSSKDHTVRIWNIYSGRLLTVISGHSDSVECVKWGGSGLVYSCSRDRTIMVWAVDGHGPSQPKIVRTLSGHAHRINTLALNCDYVLRTGCYQLGGPKLDRQGAEGDLQAAALQRYQAVAGSEGSGERLVSGSDDFTLFLWSPQEGKQPVARMTGHQQLVNDIVFSPDARYIASASFDKKVKLWCGKTGRFLATCSGHVGSVYRVAWSADSNYVVSASKDSTIKLWSVKDPKKAKFTLPGHADEVYSLDWSPDGTQVASGSKDRTIKIWHH